MDSGSVAAKKLSSAADIIPADTLNQVELLAGQGPNFWKLLGVTMVSFGACFYAMRNALGMQN